MLPIRKNKETCSPISSNCVIWQGPDIPCIDLCNGDTVSDIVSKLATQLCDLIDAACVCEPDISDLDLKCTLTEGDTAPDTLQATIQLIIDYVCALTPDAAELPTLNLPECLQYEDEFDNPVTSLRLDLYAQLLAAQICDILDAISIINGTLENHENRLVILENCVLPCGSVEPTDITVISQCIDLGTSMAASQLLLLLEASFCNLHDAVGTIERINDAMAAQCITGADNLMFGEGTYSTLPTWVSSPASLAESHINMWLVICDLYNAVRYIKETCCGSECADIVYDCVMTPILDGNSIATGINFNFDNTVIPGSFLDCGSYGVQITMTDVDSLQQINTASIVSLQHNPSGTNIVFSGLNQYGNIEVRLDYCLTNGANNCQYTVTSKVQLDIPCPEMTISDLDDVLTVTANNPFGPTAVISINVYDSDEVLISTTPFVSPGTVITDDYGLAPGTYYVNLTITINGITKECPLVEYIIAE